jgi:predicted nucleic acid-binding protein
MKVAVDTNVLAYAEGTNGKEKRDAALALLDRLPPESTLLPVQTLGELFNVLVKKANRTPASARAAVLSWGDAFPLIETSASILLLAVELVLSHKLGIWDALILSGAADEGCRLVLSEDLQEGFTWNGVTVVNPFAAPRHALLESFLTIDE